MKPCSTTANDAPVTVEAVEATPDGLRVAAVADLDEALDVLERAGAAEDLSGVDLPTCEQALEDGAMGAGQSQFGTVPAWGKALSDCVCALSRAQGTKPPSDASRKASKE